VFTSRPATNSYYNSWKAGNVRIDVRDLPARDVIGISISEERQNQQNVIKLKSLDSTRWRSLVDLIARDGLSSNDEEIGRILGYQNFADARAEILAAKSNMNNVVNHLHDPNSQLMNGTIDALREGHCVVVDISMLSSSAGNNVAGLLMRRIFNYNQENFTGESPIPVISIIEEAQSVLGKNLEESSPFVEWVKEGRKYDLGAILVTQQPGSMSPELLSQADNWFCFHLLSEGDAGTLGKYNSHYSHDVLAHLISEPIPGNCYMWSAPKQPFVLPVRIRSFEELYGKNVNKTGNIDPFLKSVAFEIRKKSEERNAALADALKRKIKETNTLSTQEFEGEIVGLYGGQLFIFLKQIKESEPFKDEHRSENELKTIILGIVLGCEITIIKARHGTKDNVDFFCAPKSYWSKILTT
jgi:hypothetical protein